MPLSEHEQRLLEQIERALLAEDPKFASTVRATDPRHHARRRIVLAAIALVGGIVLMLVGVANDYDVVGIPVLGVLGFVIMLAATVWGAQTYRRASSADPLASTGGPGATKGGSRERSRNRAGRPSFLDRLEDRWRRRADDET